MNFYTSDEHYFHFNIIKYTDRPFKTVEEMNETIINNHNSIVGKDDVVWHLGDFSFGTLDQTRRVIKRLNGTHHLIVGNHCKFTWAEYINAGFTSVQKYVFLNFPGIGPVGLAHDPATCIVSRETPWLVGHMHQQFTRIFNCINVGLDVRSYKPISETELAEDFKRILISIKHNFKEEIIANKEILGIEVPHR